jgi:hypothetical protein
MATDKKSLMVARPLIQKARLKRTGLWFSFALYQLTLLRRCWYVAKPVCDALPQLFMGSLHLLVRYARCLAAYQQRHKEGS